MHGGRISACPNCGKNVYRWVASGGKVIWYEPFGKGSTDKKENPHKCAIWVAHHCCDCYNE